MSNNNDIDEAIKEELLGKIMNEGNDKPKESKVYPQISGLPNLGRTYFVSKAEVDEKNRYAQTQMAQKYGAEIYGISGQQASQRANSTSTGGGSTGTQTGSGTVSPENKSGSGLIVCTINPFLKIPEKGFKESSSSGKGDAFKQFKDALDACTEIDADTDVTDDKEKLKKCSDQFVKQSGPNDSHNQELWEDISEIFNYKTWRENEKLKSYADEVKNKWRAWVNAFNEMERNNSADWSNGNDWNPNYSFRLDIKTDFNEQWYKRNFKSGLLNKALMTFKTAAMSKVTNPNNPMKDHKYTADEMLPQDARKLDSIQWKMTNKVAEDFITYALGWSRKKQLDGDTKMPTSDLVEDTKFGKKMASKALDNRGTLSRWKQQLFSGGQNTNTISVAFQLADPNDGSWSKQEPTQQVSESTKPQVITEECGYSFAIPLTESVMENILNEVYKEELNESIDERIFEYLNKGE